MRHCFAVFVAVCCTVALDAQSAVKTVDDGVLDHVELFVSAPPAPSETMVIVRAFDTSAADLGTGGTDGKEARQQEASTIQKDGPAILAEAVVSDLQEGGGYKGATYAPDAGAPLPAGAIVVEGAFAKINPGSRAKRYFAGFGAGKSEIEVTGTVKDADGKTLASFRQKRVGAMGIGGGDSLNKMKADCENIGEDIAKFLSRWAKGEKLK